MTDDDRPRAPREARSEDHPRTRRDDRPRHTVVNDGELLDIGPDAETIDDPSARATERVDLGEPRPPEEEPDAAQPRRTAPRFGSAGSGGAEYEPGPERP